jgi:hypothetical protein
MSCHWEIAMKGTSALLASLALALGLLASVPAEAVNFKSYVSTVGSDANDCASIATACHNFQRAHDQTSPGGQIACVDSVAALGINITKSITIDCAGTAATSTALLVDSPGVTVVIRNLNIQDNIGFVHGATLIVENCVVNYAVSPRFGIWFQPVAGSRLFVTNTLLINNGFGTTGAGILVQPQSGGSADVVLDRVRVENNPTGVFVNAPAGTFGVHLTMRDSTVAGNSFTGFAAVADGPTLTVVIENSAISNNGGIGLLAQGAQAFVFVNRSTISGNDTGWTTMGGGNLVTEGTNSVYLNRSSNGAPSASIGLQ